MAIRALNICRDATATSIFINGLKDDNELVRLESAKALANIPDPRCQTRSAAGAVGQSAGDDPRRPVRPGG